MSMKVGSLRKNHGDWLNSNVNYILILLNHPLKMAKMVDFMLMCILSQY